jgi:hypothetical protein
MASFRHVASIVVKCVVALAMLILTMWSAKGSIGLDLTSKQSTLFNDYQTYTYNEPCAHMLRNPPFTQANLSYGFGRITGATFSTTFPAASNCVRLSGTDNATYAYVASNYTVTGAEATKNGSVSADSTNLTERMTLRLTAAVLSPRFLVVAHQQIHFMGAPSPSVSAAFQTNGYAAFLMANGTTGGNCSVPAFGKQRAIRLSCLEQPIMLNGTANLSSQRLVLFGPGPAIYFSPINTTTEWFYVVRPNGSVEYWEKMGKMSAGAEQSAAWSWVDACLLGEGCVLESWTVLTNADYGVPNMSNTTNATAIYGCRDFDTTDGNGCFGNVGCRMGFQRSTTGAYNTVATSGQGTATDPFDCGGLACSAVVSGVRGTTCWYNATESNATNGSYVPGNLSRVFRLYRTNLTGNGVAWRPFTDFETPAFTGPVTLWKIASPGAPNVTNNLTCIDGNNVANKGVNQSSRILSNVTVFTWFPISDGTLVNASLWGNLSVNGSNSTTFRLLGTNNSCVANQTCTIAFNVTDAGNYSWMACIQNNVSNRYGTANTTGLGFGCTRTWVRNTSNYTTNQTSQGERTVWFNASVPVAVLVVNSPPNVSLLFPLNNSGVSANWTALNWTVADNESATLYCNVTINNTYLIFPGGSYALLNNTIGWANFSIANDSTYIWNVTCCDTAGLCNTALGTFTSSYKDWMLHNSILIIGVLCLGLYFAMESSAHLSSPHDRSQKTKHPQPRLGHSKSHQDVE